MTVQVDTAMSTCVAAGNGRLKSAKIFWNFGMMKIMMKVKMPIATRTTTVGYTMAPVILRLRLWAFSLKSARRWRMTSRAPPASPAFTMFT